MTVDPQSALRGVRTRLVGAVIAASTTLMCVLYVMLSSLSSFGSTFALTVGMCSFGAAVALLLSARHEEEVHELAAEFDKRHQLDGPAPDHTGARAADRPIGAGRAEPRALPEPNLFRQAELFERVERAEKRGVKRRDYTGQTDGVL